MVLYKARSQWSSFYGFYTSVVVSLYLSWENKKKPLRVNLNCSFYHYKRFSRICCEKKWGNVKSAVYKKRCVQLGNLFRPIVPNTLNSHQFRGIWSTCVIKVGSPFWKSLMLPLNSKIGPVPTPNFNLPATK